MSTNCEEVASAPAIQLRAKGVDKKTPVDVIGARLWTLGCPIPLSYYAPPWDSVGGDLWSRLLCALAAPAARKVADPASLLGYAECTKSLLLGAPAVYRAITDIRGLTLAAAPAIGRPPNLKNKLPGELLVYEECC